VLGDKPGPKSYPLPAVRFFDLEAQRHLPFALARLLPEKHYTRKNLGYLLAIQSGTKSVVETDDDNIPLGAFWEPRTETIAAQKVELNGWYNVYSQFSTAKIWPRGFPLQHLQTGIEPKIFTSPSVECLIQQGLANKNPDVDAIYRLIFPLPLDFNDREALALGRHCWCPFNSQNTTFFKPAFPLLYLPSFCTFRMTDIWRSFIAQRCLWEMGSMVAFTKATVYQERNEHNLLKDFEQEIPGYLNNDRIREVLEAVELKPGRSREQVSHNLLLCYEALVTNKLFPGDELALVRAWIDDLAELS